jgi:ATP-dependent RNA helicase DDX5/DBP2
VSLNRLGLFNSAAIKDTAHSQPSFYPFTVFKYLFLTRFLPLIKQAWPVALSGRDVIVVAKTGSGKTLGFLLPAFHRLQQSQAGGFKATIRAPPSILVLAPTRELACQIEQEAQKFGKSSGIRSVTCYGGAPKALQIRQIRMGIEVAIATPGRMNDLLEMGCIDLSKVQFLVLDEADRM